MQPGQLEVQVFQPGEASITNAGLEAGAVTPRGPFAQDVLANEPVSPTISIPIFIFGFMFVLFAVYLAKKMKLIKDSKTNFQQMERA